MKNYLFVFFSLLFTTSSINGQKPGFSATQNWLDGVNHGTCMQRAKEALLKNGFTANQQTDNVSFIGSKSGYDAFLICQSCQDKVITTIVLSTSLPITEANDLREKMLYYIATGKENAISTGAVSLITNKTIYAKGEKISVQYSGMAGYNQDWITLVERGKPDEQYGPWKYTNGNKSGTMEFDPLPPGEYEARAYFNNGYKVEKRCYFTVTGNINQGTGAVTGKQLKIDKAVFVVGEKINVKFFNTPGNSTDWIAVSEANKPETQFVQWLYTGGLKDGALLFNALPAGDYETRLFYNNSYKIEDKIAFRVINNPEGDFIIKTEKTEFNENEPIRVFFSNAQGSNVDWISICVAGSADGQYGQWFHKGALASGELNFKGLASGQYEIRYYLNNGYEVKKRIPIKVIKR